MGARAAFKGLYDMAAAIAAAPGHDDSTSGAKVLFLLRTGVLQGCPLSGLLFVLAMDTTLR